MNRKLLTVQLLSRPGCHLCEEAHEVLQQLSSVFPIEVIIVDISGDLEALAKYRNHIPVGLLGEEELFRHRADLKRLSQQLKRIIS